MAKEKVKVLNKGKKNEKQQLMVKFSEWTPEKIVDGKRVVQVNDNGEPVTIPRFTASLTVLGKMMRFNLMPKEKTERELLVDFFKISGKEELPLEIVEKEFKDDNGKTVKSIVTRVALDDIHIIDVKCADVERGKFKMAINEYLNDYIASDAVKAYRKQNYESALLASEYSYDEICKMSKDQKEKALKEIQKQREEEFQKREAERLAKAAQKDNGDDLPF